jgi:hypothetical protein
MLSIISHPHTTLLRALWTSARIPRFAAHGLYLTSGTAYSAHSSCGLRAVRLVASHSISSLTLALRTYRHAIIGVSGGQGPAEMPGAG